jgi:hypothetical protein
MVDVLETMAISFILSIIEGLEEFWCDGRKRSLIFFFSFSFSFSFFFLDAYSQKRTPLMN